jgi:hypothetical protein
VIGVSKIPFDILAPESKKPAEIALDGLLKIAGVKKPA